MGVREDAKKFKILRVLMFMFVFSPTVANAVAEPANFTGLVTIAVNALADILPLIVTLAFIYFVWGLARYLKNAGENKDEAKAVMLHGIIAFFVMSSVWGLVGILTTTFGEGQHIPIKTEFVDKGVKDSLKIYQEDLLKELESDTTELKDMLPADYGGQVSWPAKEPTGSGGWLIPGSFPDEAATDMQAAPSDTGFKSWLPWNWGN